MRVACSRRCALTDHLPILEPGGGGRITTTIAIIFTRKPLRLRLAACRRCPQQLLCHGMRQRHGIHGLLALT